VNTLKPNYKKWSFQLVRFSKLKVSPFNIRKKDIEGDFQSLKENIKKNGILEELEVVKLGNDYLVTKGQRRLRAIRELIQEGIPLYDVPCVVKELGEKESLYASFITDYLRKPVMQEDYAQALIDLATEGETKEEIMETLSMSEQDFDYYMSLKALQEPSKVDDYKEGKPSVVKETLTPDLGSLNSQISNDEELKQAVDNLSIPEKLEMLRRVKNTNAKIPRKDIVKQRLDELKTSRIFPVRVDLDIIEGLKSQAIVTGSKDPSYELELLIRTLIKEDLRKKGYIV